MDICNFDISTIVHKVVILGKDICSKVLLSVVQIPLILSFNTLKFMEGY